MLGRERGEVWVPTHAGFGQQECLLTFSSLCVPRLHISELGYEDEPGIAALAGAALPNVRPSTSAWRAPRGRVVPDSASANIPKLKDVQPPFDPERPPKSPLAVLRAYPALFKYLRRYGFFVIPSSIDRWEYRDLLQALDPICLRVLRSKGALTAEELVDWINRRHLLDTKPAKTGINAVTAAIGSDWLHLARRRGLVTTWPATPPHEQQGAGPIFWTLTEDGRGKLRSPLRAIAARLPLGPIVTFLVGGGLITVITWLIEHPDALVVIGAVAVGFVYVGLVLAWFQRTLLRTRPRVAVVAIETFRSADKPPPSFDDDRAASVLASD